MEVNFTLTKSDLVDYYKITNRNTFLVWGVLVLVFSGFIIAGAIIQNINLLALGIIIVIFSLIFMLLTFLKVLAVYKKSAQTLKDDVVTVELNQDYIRVKKSGKVRWEYLFDLLEFKNLFVLKLNKNSVFILPKRALSDQAQSLLKEYYQAGLKKRKLSNKK